jgi:hypothetical protein
MKVVLKIVIVLFGLISIGIGAALFWKNGRDANDIAELGALGGMLGDMIPTPGALKNGGIAALVAALSTFALIIVSFMKNAKNIVIVAAASAVFLVACYFIQPDYGKGITKGATARQIAGIQLGAGILVAGMAVVLSRKINA